MEHQGTENRKTAARRLPHAGVLRDPSMSERRRLIALTAVKASSEESVEELQRQIITEPSVKIIVDSLGDFHSLLDK